MRRVVGWTILALLLLGCHSPERAVQPLPPDAPPLTYQELLLRAKSQVSAAQEFFYRDSWREVEQAAVALRQTAELLGKAKAEDVPARQKEHLGRLAKELGDAANALGESAKVQDAIKTTGAFQRLHLAIRDLRAE